MCKKKKKQHLKLHSKKRKCIFIRYDSNNKTYWIDVPTNKKLIITRDIILEKLRIKYQNIKNNNSDKNLEDVFFILTNNINRDIIPIQNEEELEKYKSQHIELKELFFLIHKHQYKQ